MLRRDIAVASAIVLGTLSIILGRQMFGFYRLTVTGLPGHHDWMAGGKGVPEAVYSRCAIEANPCYAKHGARDTKRQDSCDCREALGSLR